MKKYLGIDVGGTKIKYGLFNSKGEEISYGIMDSEGKDLKIFIDKIKEIVNKFDDDIEGIGLSLPCILNSETGKILEAGNIRAINKINIKKIIEEETNLKVEIENDGNSVALAEKWIGNGRFSENFICITIGTGIGGAIIINDKIYKGNKYIAGEFGFMVNGNDIDNDFGNSVSTKALIQQVQKINEDEKIDGMYIFNQLEKGNLEIKEIYDKWIKSLAIGIRNLCFILDPEKVLIGGGVSRREVIIKDLRTTLNSIMPKDYEPWNIESCKFFNDAGKIGAVYNFIKKNDNRN